MKSLNKAVHRHHDSLTHRFANHLLRTFLRDSRETRRRISDGGEERRRPRRCGDTPLREVPDNGPFVRHCVRGTLIVSLRPDDLRGYDSPSLPIPPPLSSSRASSAPFPSCDLILSLPRVERGGGGGGPGNSSTAKLSRGIDAGFFVLPVTCYFANDHERQHNTPYRQASRLSESV